MEHYWNNRIIQYEDGSLGIHEVHYDEQGKVCLWTEQAVGCYGNDMEDLQLGFNLKKHAFEKPILKLSELKDKI